MGIGVWAEFGGMSWAVHWLAFREAMTTIFFI